jgi:hypothetical protein
VLSDLGIWRRIEDYATQEIRDEMRRAYLLKGPCRLIGHDFPRSKFGKDWRPFQQAWYKEYNWLEYSVEKDAAYCFHCFFSSLHTLVGNLGMMPLQKRDLKIGRKGRRLHVGKQNNAHNNARRHCEDFRNQKHSVSYAITCHTEKSHVEYEQCLRAVAVVKGVLVIGDFFGHTNKIVIMVNVSFRCLQNSVTYIFSAMNIIKTNL